MSIAPAPQLLAHRWFFALKPDDVTARRTYAFAEQELGAKGLLRPEHHHVTLALTPDSGSISSELVDALRRAGDRVSAAPCSFRLDRLVGTHRSVALRPRNGIRPLRDLHARIVAAMAREGVALRQGWTFSPHQTVCYRDGATFNKDVTGFHWAATEFFLVHSFIGLSRHETIGQWPLQAQEELQGRLF